MKNRCHSNRSLKGGTCVQGASYEAFLEAAKVADDVPIYQTEDYSVAKKVGITKPGFVLTRTFKGHHKEEAAYLKEVCSCPTPSIFHSS